MSAGVFIGIDGGGSKTAAVALRVDGRVLASVRGPASAIVGVPTEEALAPLRQTVADVLAASSVDPAEVSAWGVGLSGIDFDDERREQHAAISSRLGAPAEKVVLENDTIAALYEGLERNRK